MSRKQVEHLKKARQIKANKNRKGVNSYDVMSILDETIKNIDVSQINGNNAPNYINALVNVCRAKTEQEEKGGSNRDIKPIKVEFIKSNTTEQRLRIAEIDREILKGQGKSTKEIDNNIRALVEKMRTERDHLNDILSKYELRDA